MDDLIEDAELVANSVARRRDFQTGQRLDITGGQTPQATVAEPRLLLDRQQRIETRQIETAHRLFGLLANAQHQQVVPQLGADQEFSREVGDGLEALLAQGLLAGQMSAHQPIAHCMAEAM